VEFNSTSIEDINQLTKEYLEQRDLICVFVAKGKEAAAIRT